MIRDAASTRRTTTLRAPIRLRNAREHRRLVRRLRDGAELHHALAAFDRGIRAHNRRCFLRHPCDWQPGPGDFRAAGDPQDPDRLVRYPTYLDGTRMLAQALRQLRATTPDDPLVMDWTTAELRSIIHDYLRCRGTPARIGGFRRSLRSVTSRAGLRHTVDGAALRVQIGPAKHRRNALRATLPRPLATGERIRAIRIVRVQEGHPRVCPTQWEAHVIVEGPAPTPLPHRARPRVTGIDLGGRITATSDTGCILAPVQAPATSRALAKAVSRKRRGSKARWRTKARLRQQAASHAARRRQRLMKYAKITAREHAVVVVEDLDHAAMRAKGGRAKRGINRSLAAAAPGQFITALKRKLAERGRWLVEVPAAWTSRQCLACGSRDTELTRTEARCQSCGARHGRDHAAAANILLRGIAAHAAHHRNSGPSGSAETARSRRLPGSECWHAHRASLARDPAGTSSERLRDRAVRELAQERWGQAPPGRRCDNLRAPPSAEVARIRPDSRQLVRGAAQR